MEFSAWEKNFSLTVEFAERTAGGLPTRRPLALISLKIEFRRLSMEFLILYYYSANILSVIQSVGFS